MGREAYTQGGREAWEASMRLISPLWEVWEASMRLISPSLGLSGAWEASFRLIIPGYSR